MSLLTTADIHFSVMDLFIFLYLKALLSRRYIAFTLAHNSCLFFSPIMIILDLLQIVNSLTSDFNSTLMDRPKSG